MSSMIGSTETKMSYLISSMEANLCSLAPQSPLIYIHLVWKTLGNRMRLRNGEKSTRWRENMENSFIQDPKQNCNRM